MKPTLTQLSSASITTVAILIASQSPQSQHSLLLMHPVPWLFVLISACLYYDAPQDKPPLCVSGLASTKPQLGTQCVIIVLSIPVTRSSVLTDTRCSTGRVLTTRQTTFAGPEGGYRSCFSHDSNASPSLDFATVVLHASLALILCLCLCTVPIQPSFARVLDVKYDNRRQMSPCLPVPEKRIALWPGGVVHPTANPFQVSHDQIVP